MPGSKFGHPARMLLSYALKPESLMKLLEPPDSHYLAAAEGWLGLGNSHEAERELDQISFALRAHPEVLRVRYHLYEAGRKWELAAETAQNLCHLLPDTPFGWIHLAYSLHELKRTREAYNVLMPVVDKFPEEYILRYNLACYACQLGNIEEARQWLDKAMALGGSDEVKKTALTDPDLQPMWTEI